MCAEEFSTAYAEKVSQACVFCGGSLHMRMPCCQISTALHFEGQLIHSVCRKGESGLSQLRMPWCETTFAPSRAESSSWRVRKTSDTSMHTPLIHASTHNTLRAIVHEHSLCCLQCKFRLCHVHEHSLCCLRCKFRLCHVTYEHSLSCLRCNAYFDCVT